MVYCWPFFGDELPICCNCNCQSWCSQVVDFHWNPAEPFTIMSVADESALEKGGGTLQLWRISDLLTRPEEEVLTELEAHR